MTALERLVTSAAARWLPNITGALKEAAQVPALKSKLAGAENTIEMYREEMYGGRHRVPGAGLWARNRIEHELAEAEMMGGGGPAKAMVERDVKLTERLWELELALDDRGWQRENAIMTIEFSRYGLNQIIRVCRLYFIKNPLVKRGVKISSYYVFGRGFEIRCEDETANDVIQKFLNAPGNLAELGHIGLVAKEETIHSDGNLFVALFEDEGSGETVVRTIDAIEINEIVCNPDDASEPWYYQRRWNQQVFNPADGTLKNENAEAWYPALGYEPDAKLKEINSKPVMWNSPVCHMKVDGLAKWKFGCPPVYAALDWARSYQHFLEDWCTITRALARFAWNVETKGGQQAIQAFQQVMTTTLADGGTQIERNPPPTTGAAFVTGPGNKLTPMRTAGASTEPEQGRRVLLMVAAAFGLPETFFGDASTGSLATAQSLDRPTELKFLEAQERWREFLQRICMEVLRRSNSRPAGKLREARKKANKNGDLSDITVSVKFPAILEHDVAQMVSAIVQATTLSGFQPAGTIDIRTAAGLLLAELGVEDVNKVLDAMYPPEEYDPEVKPEEQPPAGAPHGHAVAPSFAQEARMLEAVTQLRRASEKLLAKMSA